MAALSGAAIGAIASAGIQGLSNLATTAYTTERNIWNANDQARIQREFEKNLASTQYQRAVADMEAAGLNPAAIGSGMSSNAVPSGAAALGSYGTGSAPNFGSIFSSAVAAAMAKDKNLTRQVMQEMRDETALQVQRMRNAGAVENEVQKKALGHSAYRFAKNSDFSSNANEPIVWDEL